MNIYCSQLGMIIEFSYCVSMNEGLPCRNAIRCWRDRMDIEHHLKEILGEEGFHKNFSGLPKTKLERIIELVNNSAEKD